MFNIYRFQDIHTQDVSLKRQYYDLLLSGDVEGAHAIYSSHPKLNGKCLNAESLNQLLNSVLALENNYNNGVTIPLANTRESYQVNINELLYMDEFDETKQYYVNNFTIYNNEVYYCISKPPIGQSPTSKEDDEYWVYLGLKGNPGAHGLGLAYLGAWDSTMSYERFDMVVYQNIIYVAKQQNTNQAPTNDTYWFKAIEITNVAMYMSETEPAGLVDGDIWLKEIIE